MKLTVTTAQDIGSRAEQEDSFGVLHLGTKSEHPVTVVVVADGMGGHAMGAEASRRAVAAVLEQAKRCGRMLSSRHHRTKAQQVLDIMVTAACTAVEGILPDRARGPGTTLLIALCWHDHVLIRNVGDSRATWIADDQHAPVDLTPPHHGAPNMLTSFIPRPHVQDTFEREWALDTFEGQRGALVLSSDGLTLSAHDMEACWLQHRTWDLAPLLIEEQCALRLPHQDNVTAVAVVWSFA